MRLFFILVTFKLLVEYSCHFKQLNDYPFGKINITLKLIVTIVSLFVYAIDQFVVGCFSCETISSISI